MAKSYLTLVAPALSIRCCATSYLGFIAPLLASVSVRLGYEKSDDHLQRFFVPHLTVIWTYPVGRRPRRHYLLYTLYAANNAVVVWIVRTFE